MLSAFIMDHQYNIVRRMN